MYEQVLTLNNTQGLICHKTLPYQTKADNHILSIISRTNGMIGWMVRNFISKEENIVFKIYDYHHQVVQTV